MGLDDEVFSQTERGWRYSEHTICINCVGDTFLADRIQASAVPDTRCTYCDSVPAATVDVATECLMFAIESYFEKAEGTLAISNTLDEKHLFDAHDVVDYFAIELKSPALIDEICSLLPESTWVERSYFGDQPDQIFLASWRRFSHEVKFVQRYTFWTDEESHQRSEFPVAEVLERIGKLVHSCGMARRIEAGAEWHRARWSPDETFSTAGELGTVPATQARQANRMTPPGIAHFYGSSDAATAVDESRPPETSAKFVSVGSFQPNRDLLVIDLTELPTIPSAFDTDQRERHFELMFLEEFSKDLSSVSRPGWEEVDYVPTQILTEYLLRYGNAGGPVDGLVYRSAISGERNIVLAVQNDRCMDSGAGTSPNDR